jgi:hypothetical protein
LQLDLVALSKSAGVRNEVIPRAPARWYLSGFIVLLDSDLRQRTEKDGSEEIDEAPISARVDDATPRKLTSAGQRYQPSLMGLSVLAPEATKKLSPCVGNYKRRKVADGRGFGEEWERQQRQEESMRAANSIVYLRKRPPAPGRLASPGAFFSSRRRRARRVALGVAHWRMEE